MEHNIYLYILVMAATTYMVRMLPLVLTRHEIKSTYIKSFLYYVPYACLAAMTVPAVLLSDSGALSMPRVVGFIVAVIAAYREKKLLTVALLACGAVFIMERVLAFLG